MKTKKNSKRTFSIFAVVITVLVVFSLAGTASMLLLSKKYSEAALHSLADEIINRTVDDASEHVNMLLKPAVNAVGILESQIPEGASLPGSRESSVIVSAMMKTLHSLNDVYSVYYANKKGEFFLIGRRQRYKDDKKKYFFYKRISISHGVRTVTESWYSGGKQVETQTLDKDTYDPLVRPWYQKAVFKNGPVWTSPYIFYITKLPGITFARPVYSNGVLAGVVAADLEINTISDFMKSTVFTKHTQIFALDSEDNVIAHSGFSQKYNKISILKDHIPKSEDFADPVLHALKAKVSETGSYGKVCSIEADGRLYKGVLHPFSFDGMKMVMGIYTPASDYLMPLRKNFRTMIFVSLLLLVFVIFLSKLVSKELARPLKELRNATESARELDFDKNISIRSGLTEVSATQNNFNLMLESLRNYKSANEILSDTLNNAHIDTLYRLALAAEHKDQYTYDHLKRVSDISVFVAETIGMPSYDIEQLRHASPMHDVGKLGIPDSILMKPGRLTAEEFEVIKTHAELGAKILENPSSEIMHNARIIARSHHERWDGKGYPDNLSGESIPIYGRIVTIADVIDALLSKRPYKEAYTFERTIRIIASERGGHFDPELTDVVLENQDYLYRLLYGSLS